jgi:ubiquinone/menaquinone biosynthesis C-methylase UbiE
VTGAEEAKVDYSEVTELVGARGSRAQFARMCQRYQFAAGFCAGKEVLEVACGAGQGLGFLARRAKRVVGMDVDEGILAMPRERYGKRIEIRQGNAEALPFADQSFDVVLLLEAIYYLRQPQSFIAEAKRVLRSGGILFVCSANKDLPDFNPSPFSNCYYGPPELSSLFEANGFSAQYFGGDPVGPQSLRSWAFQTIKRAAVKLELVPKTMRGKEPLKRLFFGPLVELPDEVPEKGPPQAAPIAIPSHLPDRRHRVLYAVAQSTSAQC